MSHYWNLIWISDQKQKKKKRGFTEGEVKSSCGRADLRIKGIVSLEFHVLIKACHWAQLICEAHFGVSLKISCWWCLPNLVEYLEIFFNGFLIIRLVKAKHSFLRSWVVTLCIWRNSICSAICSNQIVRGAGNDESTEPRFMDWKISDYVPFYYLLFPLYFLSSFVCQNDYFFWWWKDITYLNCSPLQCVYTSCLLERMMSPFRWESSV